MLTWTKPVEGEYLPYQISYISKVADGDLISIMKKNIEETTALLNSLPEEKISYRYAEGKWDIAEVLQHLIDTERIMCYRALRFARNDKTELPGFEQDDYVKEANTGERKFIEMLEEFAAVRASTISLFESFNDTLLNRSGVANKGTVKVKSLAYVIAGHELHHVGIIKERYL